MKWIETRNWEDAFWAVIPKRKFQNGLQGQSGGGEHENSEQENDGRSDIDGPEAVHVQGEAEVMEIGMLSIAHSEGGQEN